MLELCGYSNTGAKVSVLLLKIERCDLYLFLYFIYCFCDPSCVVCRNDNSDTAEAWIFSFEGSILMASIP